ARAGAAIVITDSNRRRAFVNSRIRANAGRTLDATAPLPPDVAVLDPFERGSDAQTVAVYGGGARYVRGTVEASFSQFPERGPMAALDGDPSTSWITNAFLRPDERPYLEVGFPHARDVGTISLLPYGDRRGRPVEVRIAGSTYALRRGWNRLRLGLHDVRALRVEISRSAAPPRGGGPGGIRELRIPGLHVRERLRTPLVAAHALRGRPLERSRLTLLLERTTPFSPLRLSPPAGELQDRDLRNRAAAETSIERELELPAARRFRADAWVSAGFDTPDRVLDRLAGYRGPARFDSSARFEGVPGRRASKAFDRDRRTSWIGAWQPGRPAWIEWRTPEARPLRSLRLTRALSASEPTPTAPGGRASAGMDVVDQTVAFKAAAVRFPTRVRLRWPGGATPVLTVGRRGIVRLPYAVRARRLRLEIVAAAFPAHASKSARRRRAVGIGDVTGSGVPTVGPDDIGRAAAPLASAPSGATRGGVEASGDARTPGAALHARCGDAALTVAGTPVPLRPTGTVADLDAGRPLRAEGCASVGVPAGRVRLSTAAGPLRTDLLRLDAPAPRPTALVGGGRVLDPGKLGRGTLTNARVSLDGPSWLVLGESYSKAWRAECDGHDLGEPVPIDGYANGWQVDRCTRASFSFKPIGTVRVGYGISIVAVLALLGLLLLRRPG
ncbi:MAG TPA: discoidin domain-containing protein, partial [Thermoleophilaceae bacterium]